GNPETGLVEGGGEIWPACGQNDLRQQVHAPDEAFVAVRQVEAVQCGLRRGRGDGAGVGVFGDECDDAPPGGGVWEDGDTRVAHEDARGTRPRWSRRK